MKNFFKKLIFVSILIFSIVSCSKEEVDFTGNLSVSIQNYYHKEISFNQFSYLIFLNDKNGTIVQSGNFDYSGKLNGNLLMGTYYISARAFYNDSNGYSYLLEQNKTFQIKGGGKTTEFELVFK